MTQIWKNINNIEYDTFDECVADYKKRCYKLSPWIEDIIEKYEFAFNNYNTPIKLVRKRVSELGFDKATEIQFIYEKIQNSGYELVPPEIAIYSRKLYDEQPQGEWLRFASPLNSMIDSDGIPHLPKLGRALGYYFIETYWAYPKAIFHPHNEFVVCKYDF